MAIKTLKPGSMTKEKFLAEASIMKDLQHDKIVKLLAIVSVGEPLMIISEFMDTGDLRNFLVHGEGINLGEEELRAISFQVCTGIFVSTSYFVKILINEKAWIKIGTAFLHFRKYVIHC